MAKKTPDRSQVPPAMIAAAVVLLLAIVGFIGWRSLGGGGSGRVQVDIEKVKQNIKQNGLGRR